MFKNLKVSRLYKFIPCIVLIALIVVFPDIASAAPAKDTGIKADIAPFWKGIKSLINVMRYLVGGIAVIAIIFIGLQKLVSIIVPSDEGPISHKFIGLIIGLGIVMFAPDLIKVIAEMFDKNIELPI